MHIFWMIIFYLLPAIGASYVGWHVWQILPLRNVWRWCIVLTMVGCLSMLGVVLTRSLEALPVGLAPIVYKVGTSSVFILLYLVMLFLFLDLGRLLRIVPCKYLHSSKVGSVAVLGFVMCVFTYAHITYMHKVRVELELTTTKTLQKPLRIVMLSDLHLGYHNGVGELHRWVDLINAEQPELILIAGDIIDISTRPVIDQDMAAEFRRLKAPVYTSLGNHEYYSGNPESVAFIKQAGIHLLTDSVANVMGINIVARDDRSNPRRKTLKELTASIDKSAYTILLDHQPYHLEEAEQCGIDFQLSGHTHHGQMWPISWATDAMYEKSWGSHQRGSTHYYISSGIGQWGAQFRIGTQSEYVIATLH